ncbi:serine hydrolase [Altererythrobacter sp. ZODW24]|uniref:serine hydrolase domain-containing protein n=1 Tax=Altererythrobacter sp. ZODW24 TaxID=2185142 RepID=UPI000DF7B749|nr:serine hydrolase [Altererythrobacter sp. ZODW24]
MRAQQFAIILVAFAAWIAPAAHAQIAIPALDRSIKAGEFGKFVAVEVEQGGETVLSKRYDGKAADRRTDIRSAGKSLTALAIGTLVDDGKLTTDTKVWPLLGSAEDDLRNRITVHDLLTMSSALDCNDQNRKSPGQEERMYRTRVWRDFAMTLPLDDTYQRDADGQGRYSYCTAGVFLLGQVVQEVSGQRFDAYMAQHIFEPLGIDNVKWRSSRSGEIQSGGQIEMRARDLAVIGRMVLDGGTHGDTQIVSKEWVDRMLTPHVRLSEYVRYGYLWWFTPVKSPRGFEPSWMMRGNGGNIVSIYRDYDAVIVIQARNYNKKDAYENSFKAMWAVMEALPPPAQSEAKSD